MRRNISMHAAGALFLATMFTTCMVSGTYAKYTSSSTVSDSARVAKFGIVASVTGSLFGEAYTGPDSNTIVEYTDTSATVRVSQQGTNIFAPGTQNNDGMTVSITGKPEVDVNIKVEIQPREPFIKSGFTYAVIEKITGITAANIDTYRGDSLYSKNPAEEAFRKVGSDAYNENYTYYSIKSDSLVELPIGHAYYPLRFSSTALSSNGQSYSPPADDLDCNKETMSNAISRLAQKPPFDGSVVYWHTDDYVFDEDNPARPADDQIHARMTRCRSVDIDSKNNVDVSETLKHLNHKITWNWDYSVSDRNNKLDTILAVAAAENPDRIAVAFEYSDTERRTCWNALTKNDDSSYGGWFMEEVFRSEYINLDAGIDIVMKISQID